MPASVKILVIATSLFLTACVTTQQNGTSIVNVNTDSFPEGTIVAVNGDIMIPYDEPVNDCKAYKIHAPGRYMIQIVYFNHGYGKFLPTHEGAICE